VASLPLDILTQRMERAWRRKDFWSSQLTEAYALATPSRNMFQQGRTPGDTQGELLYDGTLQNATSNLANKLQAEYFSSFSKFLRVVPGVAFESAVENIEQREQIQKEINQVNGVHEAAMEISNFDQAVGEMLIDYSVGTGFMMPRKGTRDRPLEYLAVNPAHIAMSEGPNSEIWEYYRKHKLYPRLVQATWESMGGEYSDKWVKWAEDEENNAQRITVEEAIYFSQEDDTWYFVLLCDDAPELNGSEEKYKIVETKVGKTWLSPRWMLEAGEVWGRGPVLQALPEARVLNEIKKLLLQNASVSLFPPMTAVDDVDFNPAMFSFEPAYINMVSRNGGPLGAAIQKLDVGGDLRMGQFIFQEIQANIKKIMLDDNLPSLAGAVHTPTEIMERKRELQQNKAAPFGRLAKEFMRPLAQSNLNILAELKLIKPIKLDGLVFDLQIMNPTAQIQREEKIIDLERSMEVVAKINPAIIPMAYRVEHIPQWTADLLGINPELLRTSAEIKNMQEMAAQAQQQNQEISSNVN
jgi:hypothetical protein